MGASEGGGGAIGIASAILATILSLAACAAGAAEPALTLRIPLQPRKQALIELARQAGLSVGFPADLQCPGEASAVGQMTLAGALARLLNGSGCRAVRLDARTLAIEASPVRPQPRQTLVAPPLTANLPELVVTATKRETTLRTAPYAITALSGRELEQQAILGVADLSALAAGVTVTNLGPGRDKVLLRGLADSALTGHTQSTVGIYLDDLRLTYNAPDPDLRWIDIARVEVLRGPQGSLYGAGSIGGVLHVVSNPPDPSGRYGWVAASASLTHSGAASYGLDAMLNQPLGDRAAVRLVGWSQDTGGYIENVATGRRNVDRTRRQGVRAAVSWQALPDLTLTTAIVKQAINSADTHYAQPSVGPYARAVPSAEPHDNDFQAIDFTVHWTPSWADVTFNTGVLEHDVVSRYDASLAPASLAPPGERPSVFDEENDIKGFVNEARIASRGPSRLQWLVGGFAAFGQQDLTGVMLGASGATGYSETRRDRLLETALFGELSYDLTSRITLTAGGRLFRSSVKTQALVDLANQSSRFAAETSDSGFAPKFLAAYRATDALTLYVQAADGYRSGGFNTSGLPSQVFGDQPGAAQPLRRYAGDKLWSYEAGARWQPLGGTIRLRASAFHVVWSHIQADMLLPNGLQFTANIGSGRSDGVELEGSYAHGPLTVSANVVAQNPELNRPDPGFPSRADSSLPGVPSVSYALSASYLRPLVRGWSLDLAGRFAYVGHSHLTFDAQTAPQMGGYGDLRLSAGIRSDTLRLAVFVDNLTDSRGDTFAYGNPFSLRQIPQSTPQRPRTVGVSLMRSF